jgi:UDP-N-acetylglucosamine:LPS N-acetylglucosamine transferase
MLPTVLLLVVTVLVLMVVASLARLPAPPGPIATPAHPGARSRAVVVTGSFGAGHDAAAAQVAAVLAGNGVDVEVVDIVDAYPWGAGRMLRRIYLAQLDRCPQTWGWLLHALSGSHPTGRRLAALARWGIAALPARRLRAVLGPDPAYVVCTHPFASAALARMRREGRLASTTATYLTDPSVHTLWIHRGIDVHLAIYESAAAQAVALGATRVEVIRPLAPDHRRRPHPPRDRVLADLGIPEETAMLLVVGGSEGIGDLVESARDLVATGLGTPVVVCGHNDDLRRRVAAVSGAVALGWQDGLGDLVVAAGCVVQNAGGFTALEAMAAGTPVVSYRCLPGHGWDNAAALSADRLAAWPRTVPALVDALTDALVAPRAAPASWDHRPCLSQVLGFPTGAPAAGSDRDLEPAR